MTTRVEIGLGFTRNMGDFESLGVDFRVADDVRQGETIDSATERVYNKVEGQLMEWVEEVERDIKRAKKKGRA